MFLDIVEPLFFEEANGRPIVGGRINHHYPHALFLHAALDLLEQSDAYSPSLNTLAHPQPDQVAVFPGRIMLLHRRPQCESEDLDARFRYQTEFIVRIEERGDLVFVPGAIEGLGMLGGENFLADMKDLGKIIDSHLPDAEYFFTGCGRIRKRGL